MLLQNFVRRRWLKASLKTKVILAATLPLILILGSFTVIEYNRHRAAVFTNLSVLAAQSSEIIEDNLRHQMLVSDEEAVIQTLITMDQRDEFERVYILDLSGKVIFAPQEDQIGLQLDNRHSDCQPCHNLTVTERPGSIIVENQTGQRVFRSMQPIENAQDCTQCHDEEQRLLGLLLTDISTEPIEAPLIADLRENILWWLATILVTVLVVHLVLDRFVLQRVTLLSTAMNQFGQKGSHKPLAVSAPDELGQLTAVFNQMADKIKNRNEENLSLTQQLKQQSVQRGVILKRLFTAQEDERKRVARELHDELGQSLSGLSLQTQLLIRLLNEENGPALTQLNHMKSMLTNTTDNMYNLILALRPSALDDLGLVPALQVHATRMLAGMEIQFDMDTSQLNRRLPPVVETALFRIAQEALTNIIRHAKATDIHISLACHHGSFTGLIADNGQGFDPDDWNGAAQPGRNGWGLLGMQERVTQCGGRLIITSKPGEGTCLQIDIPLGEHLDE